MKRRGTRAWFACLLLLILVACRSAPPTPSSSPVSPTSAAPTAVGTSTPDEAGTPAGQATRQEFAYGFNVAWRGDDEGDQFNQRTAEMVKAAGFRWVRVQVEWKALEREPGQWDFRPLDRLVSAYAPHGINILVSIVEPPEWARDPSGEELLADYQPFEEAMRRLARRYRGQIQAWEIWNEQNLSYAFGGHVKIEPYCRLLQAGYEGIKQADPGILVVFGGLTPTGVNDPTIAIDDVYYLEQFYQLDGGRCTKYFDVLGVHANATHNPPDTMWPDNPGPGPGWRDHPSFYFRRAEQLRAVMEKHGDTRPVWITEFGWTTANPAPGYEYGAHVSEQEQAQYLVRAFEIARTQWPWVTGMFVWNLNFSTIVGPEDEKGPWSVLNPDWSPRPAYEALQRMPKS